MQFSALREAYIRRIVERLRGDQDVSTFGREEVQEARELLAAEEIDIPEPTWGKDLHHARIMKSAEK